MARNKGNRKQKGAKIFVIIVDGQTEFFILNPTNSNSRNLQNI